MSKRDIIVIAVLLNAGVLAILFMLAINDNEEIRSLLKPSAAIVKTAPDVRIDNQIVLATSTNEDFLDINIDETDSLSSDDQEITLEKYTFIDREPEQLKPVVKVAGQVQSSQKNSSEGIVEITVKRGDSLDKLARNNGTTIEAIKKVNQLKSDMLSVGQVLRIPANSKTDLNKQAADSKSESNKKIVADSGSAYYILKTGDSPWKVAKQNHMNVDDLLKLNHLDEEKARNLKVGDKIRIK